MTAMQSIGTMLKEAREQRQYTLEDVHTKIKIHPKVLQLLEEDHFERLPSPLFVKSFLRTYAMFLEIDADQMIDVYEREKRVDPDQVLYLRPAEEKEFKPHVNKSLFVMMAWLFSLVLLVLTVLFVFRSANGVITDKKKIASLQAIAAKGKAEKQKAAASAAKTAALTQRAKESEKTQTDMPVRTAEKLRASASNTALTTSEWLRSPDQGNYPKLNKKLPLKLSIEALDNVWIRVTSDGKVLFQAVLRRGASESWTATQSLEIWTGNSANMSLSVNGTAIGSPGKGVIKKMMVTHDGVKIGS